MGKEITKRIIIIKKQQIIQSPKRGPGDIFDKKYVLQNDEYVRFRIIRLVIDPRQFKK